MLKALGIIPVRIGPSVAPSVRQIQTNEKITAKVHKFSDGSRTVSEGQPEYDWTLTCSCMEDKQEILDLIEAAEANGEVTISFDVGSRSYILTNCVRNSTGISSDSDATADLTISGIAPEQLRVR